MEQQGAKALPLGAFLFHHRRPDHDDMQGGASGDELDGSDPVAVLLVFPMEPSPAARECTDCVADVLAPVLVERGSGQDVGAEGISIDSST